MVLDGLNRVAYTVRSNRADPIVLERFCTAFGYEPMVFDAQLDGVPIYHTNVMMCIGTDFALVGLDVMTNPERRAEIAERLVEPGRELIELSNEQIADFAGNAIELHGTQGRVLALSERADRSLTPHQRDDHREERPHPARRRLDHRARGRLGALHDRGNPPRPAALRCEPPSRAPHPSRRGSAHSCTRTSSCSRN